MFFVLWHVQNGAGTRHTPRFNCADSFISENETLWPILKEYIQAFFSVWCTLPCLSICFHIQLQETIKYFKTLHFCGSFLPSWIQIHWPDWIRIQYGSGYEKLVADFKRWCPLVCYPWYFLFFFFRFLRELAGVDPLKKCPRAQVNFL